MDKVVDCYTHGLNISDENKVALYLLLKGKKDPMDFMSVQDWVRQCYNLPSKVGLIMCAANELLGGFGVEGLNQEDAYVNNYWRDCIGLYVNMGDTYDNTVIWDTENSSFIITSFGDFLENWEIDHLVEEDDSEGENKEYDDNDE